MLPKDIRLDLRSQSDFFSKARLIKSDHLIAFVSNSEVDTLQAAIIVKKRYGKATQRAKIRRQLRFALTSLWKQSPTLFNISKRLVILPRSSVVDYQVYKTELENLLKGL